MTTRISALVARMAKWPSSWQGDRRDIAMGEGLVSVFAQFLEHLSERGLTSRTIRRHWDNLWVLGGEIITQINFYPEDREKTALELLDDSVDEDGGPLVRDLTESESRSFDGTCRKLHAFLRAHLAPEE